jgi:hypothetical protein
MRFFLNASWLVLLATCFALFASSLAGSRLALSTRVNEDGDYHEHITGLREGLFVLLGLMLGFTVAIVLPRFEERRQLVIDEANAIGATMWRAEILPEPQRSRTLELLREYVVVRQEFAGETLLDRAELNRQTQRTKALQRQLWEQMVAVTQDHQTAVIATYLKALNNMIDVAEKRLAAFENRVPMTVWVIIFTVALFQSFVTGFSLKRRFWFSLVITPVVIAVVMALLADLDSPRTGPIRIEQNSMDRIAHDVIDAK